MRQHIRCRRYQVRAYIEERLDGNGLYSVPTLPTLLVRFPAVSFQVETRFTE